ncbi:hypothetical protein LG290_06940 [Halomonas sediminis]|uniref:Uncharacterized protein n=1 Tax=Vreelandella zhuhanensis TaxID=2684210 RepID=A0A7X3GX98_9GAMM|nr:hypothetical protein [Halomonas zhuhanensis]MWJ26612.1 hypothetical protein [Halomonas zhuhanensis]
MASSRLMAEYQQWLTFQHQEQLSREHQGIAQRLTDARATANQVVQAYRSMAEKAATEGACYRTLFLRQGETGKALPCEGWLFIRRVLSEGNTTRVRATLLDTFTLEQGHIEVGTQPARKVTLEIFDQIQIDKGMATTVRVDEVGSAGNYHFITLLDAVRGDLRRHLN